MSVLEGSFCPEVFILGKAVQDDNIGIFWKD